MKDGRCSRQYPRRFLENTLDDNDGYPQYRRRDTGLFPLGTGFQVNNRWVVPYNRALLAKYNAHINVEVCGTIYAVKYLHKYIHKGGDRAEVEYTPNPTESLDAGAAAPPQVPVSNDDEIQLYLEGRYISTSEAVWRIFGFSLHHVVHAFCAFNRKDT
jgi:hypothetical protein